MRISIRTALCLLSILICVAIILGLVVALTAPVSSADKDTAIESIDMAEAAIRPVIFQETLVAYRSPTVMSDPPEEPVEELKRWTEEEVTVLAKMLWGEARGISSDMEKAACVWCVLNRVDDGQGTIVEVVTAPYQFVGYQESHPVDADLYDLCEDVLSRWYREKDGETDVGRVLPSDYLFFTGDGYHNNFRNAYKNGTVWTWDYESPYED